MVRGMMDPPPEVTQGEVDALSALIGDVSSVSPSGGTLSEKLETTWSYLGSVSARTVEWSMAVMGTWQVDADGARGAATAQGGLVGGTVAYATVPNAYALCEDGGVFKQLSAATGSYSAAYDVLPTVPATNDAWYVGQAQRFCEVTNDLTTAGVYTNNGVIAEYSTASGWSTFPAGSFVDNTHTSQKTGERSLSRTGTYFFRPPNDWVQKTVNGTSAYWVRFRVGGAPANITTIPRYNSKNPEIVTVPDANACRIGLSGTVQWIRFGNRAGTLSSANDYKVCLINWTALAAGGRLSGTDYASDILTWTKGNRAFIASLTMGVVAGDYLSVMMLQEDGTNEVVDCPASLTIEPT